MNDLNSLLIATTVLAIGGLGFYMYKNEQGDEYFENDFDNLDEDLEDYDDSTDEDEEDEEEEEEEESKKKNKTKRNSNGNSKTKKKRN